MSSAEEIELFSTERTVYRFKINKKYSISFTSSRLIISEYDEGSRIYSLNSLETITKNKLSYTFNFLYFLNQTIEIEKTEKNLANIESVFNFLLRYKHLLYLKTIPSRIQEEIFLSANRKIVMDLKDKLFEEMQYVKFKGKKFSYPLERQTEKKYIITVHVIYDKIKSLFESFYPGRERRNPSHITSLCYRTKSGGILLRRGPTSGKSKTIRDFENQVVNILIKENSNDSTLINNSNKKNLVLPILTIENLNIIKGIFNNAYKVYGYSLKYSEVKFSDNPNYNYKKRIHKFIKSMFYRVRYVKKMALSCCSYLQKGEVVIIEDRSKFCITHMLCSLIKIMLSGFYTTIDGFLYLISREWINYGFLFHQDFQEKKYNEYWDSKFMIWLITVQFLIWNFPNNFEFTSDFVSVLISHCCSSNYFPFINPCHYDKEFKRTENLLEEMKMKRDNFINYNYNSTGTINDNIQKETAHYSKLNINYEDTEFTRFKAFMKFNHQDMFMQNDNLTKMNGNIKISFSNLKTTKIITMLDEHISEDSSIQSS